MDIVAHLKELCAPPGLSGHEASAREAIRRAWEPRTQSIHIDRLGSLWAVKSGIGRAPRPKLMLAAHMDAIGLMVTQVQGEFLRVISVGGIDARVMPGQMVTVHGKSDLPGLVAQPADFLLPKANRDGVVPVTELVVDLGLPAADVAQQVRIGDLVSFAPNARELQNGAFMSKSLDNRSSVAVVTVCLDALQHLPHVWDVVAVATVQEEIGFQGARTSAFALEPDLAIAIDVTHGDGPNVKEWAYRTAKLDAGPALGLGPNIHSGLHHAVKAVAERLEMPHTLEVMHSHSGTDAFAIQISRAGIPTMVVSLPLRNMHTPVEMLMVKDVNRAGRLLAEFAASLTADFMNTLGVD
jgi:endoglucanase